MRYQLKQSINFDTNFIGSAPWGRSAGVTGRGSCRYTVEADDEHISGVGRVGVWTKADSVTVFDDFSFGGRPSR